MNGGLILILFIFFITIGCAVAYSIGHDHGYNACESYIINELIEFIKKEEKEGEDFTNMAASKEITIEYTETGVNVFIKTPARERYLIYESKTSKEIPEHISIHMNWAHINIINVVD